MATSALAHIMRITKQQLLTLRDTCLSVSQTGCDVQTSSGYRLSRAKFLDAMTATNVNLEPDYQILEKLFVMWDMEGIGLDPVSSQVMFFVSRCMAIMKHSLIDSIFFPNISTYKHNTYKA